MSQGPNFESAVTGFEFIPERKNMSQGPTFSRAVNAPKKAWALAPAKTAIRYESPKSSSPSPPVRDDETRIMAKPPRLHTASTHSNPRTFFITTRTAAGRALFRTLRMANLLIEVLRTYMRAGKFQVIDFVIMPDHVHLILRAPPILPSRSAFNSSRVASPSGLAGSLDFKARCGSGATPKCVSTMKKV
jgi:hypothetical protein